MNENKITHPIAIYPIKFLPNSNLIQEYERLKDFASKQASNAGSTLNQYKNLK